jgi:hypothetical protein
MEPLLEAARAPWIKSEEGRKILVVPESVEVLTSKMVYERTIDCVEFAKDTKLRRIEDYAFLGAVQLKSICIPASVDSIGGYCFCSPSVGDGPLEDLTFESGSKLRVIGDFAFTGCRRLKSVCLPASVEILGVCCFSSDSRINSSPSQLAKVTFEFGSKLRSIPHWAFQSCPELRSICLPASVRAIEQYAFGSCIRLSRVTFESNSALRLIGASAFYSCSALESFCVPSTVESIGPSCFDRCPQLSTLTFESPSRLRRLESLATGSLMSVDIPDSVEIFDVKMDSQIESVRVNFGSGSKLKQLGFVYVDTCQGHRTFLAPAFLGIPGHRLKALRRNGEFAIGH